MPPSTPTPAPATKGSEPDRLGDITCEPGSRLLGLAVTCPAKRRIADGPDTRVEPCGCASGCAGFDRVH